MSGHSKWASIKHKKALTDAKKSKAFSKIASLISIAAKKGGDPGTNPNLRLMIEKGKAAGMTKENIERAIKRGTGELGGAVLEEVTYEAYGPGGIGIIIEAVTDNRNRTVAEVRAQLNKYNGKMAETGSVSYQFNKKGMVMVNKGDKSTDDISLLAIDAGAEDIEETPEYITILTEPNSLEEIKGKLKENDLEIIEAEVNLLPTTTITLVDNNAQTAQKLLEALDDLEDVTNISTNADF
jgi:YebC/PmpR family DNA-binding regulatory protein